MKYLEKHRRVFAMSGLRPRKISASTLSVVVCTLFVVTLVLAFSLLKPIKGAERTIIYGTAADGTKLVVDIGLPEQTLCDATLRPAMVYVHGGTWIAGERSALPKWNRWLNQLGYAVFDVQYRMPPPDRWQDEVADIKSALGWVVLNAARYQIDTSRISMMGYSAGGNLSMLAAYSSGDPDLPPSCDVPAVVIRSVINFYSPVDLPLLCHTSGTLPHAQRAMPQFIGGTLDEYPDRYRPLSPICHVGPKSPPTLTFIGTSDRLVPSEQAQILDRALERARVAHELWFLPAQDHGFDDIWDGFGTQFVRAKIERFLRAHGSN